MKKLVVLLLSITMSLSLLVGCGDTKGDSSDKGKSTSNIGQNDEHEKNEYEKATKAYDVINFETNETMTCEITYNADTFQLTEEFIEGEEAVTNLSERPEFFFHMENKVSYEVMVISPWDVQGFYSSKISEYDYNHSKQVLSSELEKETYGTVDVYAFTNEVTSIDDGSKASYFYWLLEFEDGLMTISSGGTMEDLAQAQDGLDDLLLNVTLNGKAPKAVTIINNDAIEDDTQEAASATDETISYNEPAQLGDTLDTMTFYLEGQYYQFPTPVGEFLADGWEIPSVFQTDDFIQPDEYEEIAFENEEGQVIYEVTIKNINDTPAKQTDCYVTRMLIVSEEEFDFALPEGISFASTEDELKALTSQDDILQNGNYSVYTWWTEDINTAIMAWKLPEKNIEFFEFIYYK